MLIRKKINQKGKILEQKLEESTVAMKKIKKVNKYDIYFVNF